MYAILFQCLKPGGFYLEKGHTVTGVYYHSANIQHANYQELLIPDLYGDMMDRVSAHLAASGAKSFLNLGFLFTMFGEWRSLILVRRSACFSFSLSDQ